MTTETCEVCGDASGRCAFGRRGGPCSCWRGVPCKAGENLRGLEVGCAKCGTGLGRGYNPDQKMRHLCPSCAAAQRAANLAAFEWDKAKGRFEPVA